MVKVVITVEGGCIQHIMADSRDVKVMVLDYDTNGGIPENDSRVKEFEEAVVQPFECLDEVNPARVREIEKALFS